MDADSAEATANVTESLNGETKPDPTKLAQNAIIKQDVMLSGTSTQSPVSLVPTMPMVTMPPGAMATATMAGSIAGGLHESLFFGAVPTNDIASSSASENTKQDHSTLLHSAHSAISNQQHQLLGQPQVAPQFILAGQPLQGQSQAGSPNMPIQQLLIPVSTGNGTQQLLSIPLSLAAGAGNQIQLLTTSNGQIIATNLANLAQPMNVAIPNTAFAGSPAVQPLLVLAPTLGAIPAPAQTSAPPTPATTPVVSTQLTNTAHAPGSVSQATPYTAAASALAGQTAGTALPQLITNAQGQILAIGPPQLEVPGHYKYPPQVIQPQVSVSEVVQSNSLQSATGVNHVDQQTSPAATSHNSATLTNTHQHLHTQTIAVSQMGTVRLPSGGISHAVQSLGSGTTTTLSIQQPVTSISQHSNSIQSVTSAGTTPNINQLLPNTINSSDTISSAGEGTMVDGVNLDEIRAFAKQFKIRRLSLGLTQTQVGQALSAAEGPSYSQSAVCRFEKLDITPKSAQKIKPVLERWVAEAEERYKNGMQNLSEFIGSEPSKKRKRRTSFTPQALDHLNDHFERNTHPSGAEISDLGEKLNYDREVIRVWFCNKRQALKNTIKKLKAHDQLS